MALKSKQMDKQPKRQDLGDTTRKDKSCTALAV